MLASMLMNSNVEPDKNKLKIRNKNSLKNIVRDGLSIEKSIKKIEFEALAKKKW